MKNAEIIIDGYKLFRQDRLGKREGGVGVYIRVPFIGESFKRFIEYFYLVRVPSALPLVTNTTQEDKIIRD